MFGAVEEISGSGEAIDGDSQRGTAHGNRQHRHRRRYEVLLLNDIRSNILGKWNLSSYFPSLELLIRRTLLQQQKDRDCVVVRI